MTFAEYARHIGKSKAYVAKLLKEGRLKKAIVIDEATGRTYLDKELADKLFKGEKVEINDVINTNPEDMEIKFTDESVCELSYDEAKRLNICHDIIEKKISIAERRKLLVPVEEVDRHAEKIALILRDKLTLMPSQVAPHILGLPSIFEIKTYLSKAINNILEEISSIQENKEDEVA